MDLRWEYPKLRALDWIPDGALQIDSQMGCLILGTENWFPGGEPKIGLPMGHPIWNASTGS